MDQKLYKQIINASEDNDINKVKFGLAKLNFIKKINPIKNIYYHFKNLNQSENEKYFAKIEDQDLINKLLINAAKHKNINFCNYLIHSKELKIQPDLNSVNIWTELISTNNIEMIKYFLTINVNSSINITQTISDALQYAENTTNLNTLKYLLDDSNMLFHKEVNIILKEKSNYHTRTKDYELPNICKTFIDACRKNNKELVNYLLNHKEYGKLIDSFSFFEGIKASCRPENFNLMNYLLTDNDMPFKPYIDYEPNRLLQISARYNYDDILNYLIMDFNIKKPERFFMFFDIGVISQHVMSFKEQNDIDEFEKKIENLNDLFEKRNLHNSLQTELQKNKSNMKIKRKI